MWHKYCGSILQKPQFQIYPGNPCGPIKKPNHDTRNNLGKAISFCSTIKNPEYYIHFTATVETGSRFHTPSKVIFQLHVSIIYCYWDLFFQTFRNIFCFKMHIFNWVLVQN